jgi:hypothetical protein
LPAEPPPWPQFALGRDDEGEDDGEVPFDAVEYDDCVGGDDLIDAGPVCEEFYD